MNLVICSYCIEIQGKETYLVITLNSYSCIKYVKHHKAIKTPRVLPSSPLSSLVSSYSSPAIRQIEECVEGYEKDH